MQSHQYIERITGTVIDEKIYADKIISFLYSGEREKERFFEKIFSGKIMNDLLGIINFDMPLISRLINNKRFLEENGVDLSESVEPISYYTTPRKIFERKIKYWDCRPMDNDLDVIVSPADSKMFCGSLEVDKLLPIKEKFFSFDELLNNEEYESIFADGDYAVFRLTPDKYHYNHSPVSGNVVDIYEIDGRYNSCNPNAVVKIRTPYSKNKRVVTIIDTDVKGGSQIGKVAMIEVVALMIGEILQCYSENEYDNPVIIRKNQFLQKGQVKSQYRPGSSTDILIFEKSKVDFDQTIIKNTNNKNVNSRYSLNFSRPVVETEIKLRASIARRKNV